MKNRLVLFLILMLVTTMATNANPVDMRTVCEVAVKFINSNTKVSMCGVNELQLVTTYRTGSDDDAFHIFNTPNGFVIVSADDCATPILGYSDEGRFDTDNIPVQLQAYLQGFVEQIQYGIENHIQDEAIALQWASVRSTGRLNDNRDGEVVEPLVTVLWGQGCYYNTMCPENPNGQCGHVLTGCAATAMGMIIHYWSYPSQGSGTHAYTPSGYPMQSVNFGETTYDWVNMPDQLTEVSTQEEIDAVSTLLWHCGVAINTKYGSALSTAFADLIPDALIEYFNYSEEIFFPMNLIYDENLPLWYTMIKDNLFLGRPILYLGMNPNYGHAWVCDGIDSQDFLHFNWGWDGQNNGYYSLYAGVGFAMQSAIFNIHPNADTTHQVHFTIAGNWSTASNWQGGTLPEANDEVFIDVPCQLDQNAEVSALTVSDGQSLTLQTGKTLTVTGDLNNTVTSGLVIEDGAQLVHSVNDVQATVRKFVTPFNGSGNGWHFIALPLSVSIDVDAVGSLLEDEYDLYRYDESTAYWRNKKDIGGGFTALEATRGYLYANGAEVTLEFSGTLENGSATINVPLSYTSGGVLSGFNLVGNPFPCNAILDREYYVLDNNGMDLNPEPIPADTPVPPCTAVFVKAVAVGDRVVFTRATQ